ncbi:MAG: dipeptide epimerase [Phycisphaerae bacterium]|jgi:L-alanine-DL-glutamate epimerase-like enolase superfamily enzyme
MRLTYTRQRIRPRHRFATSQGGIDEKETLVVRLESEGVVGWGDVVPSALYGQSLESSAAALNGMADLLGDDPFAVETILGRLLDAFDDQRAAIAGMDSALYDWIGRRLGLPVWRLLGLDRPRKRTTFTIGVAELSEIRVKIDEALAAGYDALKVKVGTDHDDETLTMIREIFDGPLFVDANQAWAPDEATERIRALARFRLALIEQPLRKEDWREMAGLRKLGVAPIFADESCERPADVVRLHGCVDGVNIKFTKCGGIREAMRMITLARGLGMGVMLGCFVSSSLAIAPALTLASLVDHADLDGHLLLADDPFEGIGREGSVVELGDRPGLGIEPRRNRVAP